MQVDNASPNNLDAESQNRAESLILSTAEMQLKENMK